MQLTLQISLHGIGQSDALCNAIRKKAERLERYYKHIMSCRVVLELTGRHKAEGKQFSARTTRNCRSRFATPFDAARRNLEDYARAQRGDVKRHPSRAGT